MVLEFLAARAVPGVEVVCGDTYMRAELTARVVGDTVHSDAPDLARRVFDTDADVDGVRQALRSLPVPPALHVPGTVDGAELALRAVLGQQVSVAAARTVAGRLAAAHGAPVAAGAERAFRAPGGAHDARPAVTWRFPTPAALAAIDPGTLPMPRARARAFVGLAAALADGLDLRDREALLALPGIGPWTADYVALRALGDRDAWLPTDLGVRHALKRHGLTERDAGRWRPFRAYAVIALWASLSAPA